jgi:hypothetical protein
LRAHTCQRHIPEQDIFPKRQHFLGLKIGGNFCRFQKAFYRKNRSNCAAAVLLLSGQNFQIEKHFSADRPLNRRARRASTGKQSAELLVSGGPIWTAGLGLCLRLSVKETTSSSVAFFHSFFPRILGVF